MQVPSNEINANLERELARCTENLEEMQRDKILAENRLALKESLEDESVKVIFEHALKTFEVTQLRGNKKRPLPRGQQGCGFCLVDGSPGDLSRCRGASKVCKDHNDDDVKLCTYHQKLMKNRIEKRIKRPTEEGHGSGDEEDGDDAEEGEAGSDDENSEEDQEEAGNVAGTEVEQAPISGRPPRKTRVPRRSG